MKHNKALHRFTLFSAFSTFCLIVAGGLVTSTQSGLAVPDWPLSYGQLMPPMVGGILYEHSHRMVATFVGLLTTILAVWLWRKEERRWVRVLGIIALGAILVQGMLGGLTVLYMLPTPISVSHAALAQTFFSLVTAIALFTSRWWQSESPRPALSVFSPSIFRLVLLTTVAVYIQLVLGALMRHTEAGLAVPDFPFAYGQLFPALSPEALAMYNQQLIRDDIRMAADGPITHSQVLLHMLHRIWAVVVSGLIVWTVLLLRKMGSPVPRVNFFSRTMVGLLVIQIILGALTVLSQKSVALTTAHVATGALLLATCVLMTLHVAKLAGFQFSGSAVKFAPGEATA